MRILALETSGNAGSVAVLTDGELLTERQLPAGQRSAQSLVPTIQQVLAQVGWQPGQIEAVAVTVGPGSFTGLRIGLSTAKALAYGVGAAIAGVNTLEVIARQSASQARAPGPPVVKAVIDALRGQVFAATFGVDSGGRFECLASTAVLDNRGWLDSLQSGDVVTGPALGRLAAQLPSQVVVAPATLWSPTAAMVGQLGYEQILAGHADDVFQLVPQYFRRTAAEEQWERRDQPTG